MAARKKTSKKKETAVATQETGVMSSEMQERMKNMGGAGIEKAQASDFKIPMVYICQSNSAAYDKGGDMYIEGIECGDLYDTVNRRILPENCRIIPCHFGVKAIEWVPLPIGGLVAIHDRSRLSDADVEMVLNAKGKMRPMVNDHELVETAEWIVLAEIEEGNWAQFMIPMSSSNLRASSTLCTMIAEFRPGWWDVSSTPPSFLNSYQLGTARKEKDGNSYYVFTVVVDEETPLETVTRAEALYALAASDALEAEGRDQTAGDGSPSSTRPSPQGGDVL